MPSAFSRSLQLRACSALSSGADKRSAIWSFEKGGAKPLHVRRILTFDQKRQVHEPGHDVARNQGRPEFIPGIAGASYKIHLRVHSPPTRKHQVEPDVCWVV